MSAGGVHPVRPPNRYDLYELCVQDPRMQARFLRAVHGGDARVLCEDFCGPASIARAWLAIDEDHSAAAVDRDTEPLEHAQLRAYDQGFALDRLRLLAADVREAREPSHIIAAFNFAVCELHARADLLAYLRGVRARLAAAGVGGIFAADLYGGPNAFEQGSQELVLESPWGGDVVYEWEQRRADPFTARVVNAIHFTLPDGSVMRDAFRYDWRLWSVPELRDALIEAGFRKTEVYESYGDAMDEEGNVYPVAASERAGDVDPDGRGDYVVYIIGRA